MGELNQKGGMRMLADLEDLIYENKTVVASER